MRNAALLCVLVSAFMGVNAMGEVFTLGDSARARQQIEARAENARALEAQGTDPLSMAVAKFFSPDVQRASGFAWLEKLETMKGARGVILALLAMLSSIVFVAAGRLLRGDVLPREGIRRTLAGALFVAAVLRTIDGAQTASMNQHVAKATAPLLEMTPEQVEAVVVGASGVWTLLVAGVLVLLSQYFRSEKVKQVVALQDRQIQQ